MSQLKAIWKHEKARLMNGLMMRNSATFAYPEVTSRGLRTEFEESLRPATISLVPPLQTFGWLHDDQS